MQHLIERDTNELKSQIEKFNNYPPGQQCNCRNNNQRWRGFSKEQTWDQCLKIASMRKSSITSINEYTILKRAYTTTKGTPSCMITKSLTNKTLKIFMNEIYIRLIDSRY